MFGRKKVSRRKRGMRKPIPIAPALVFQQLSVSLASYAATSITPSISEPIPIAPAPVFQPLSMPIASSAANYFPPFILSLVEVENKTYIIKHNNNIINT